jgi:hypothetical protein
MASRELVKARIAEATAQRRYDSASAFASAFITMLGLTVPLLVALFLYYDSYQADGQRSAEENYRLYDARWHDLTKQCITVAPTAEAESVRQFYCKQQDLVGKQRDLEYQLSQDLAKYDVNMAIPYGLAAGLVITGVAAAIFSVRSRAHDLMHEQARRIKLESDAEEANKPPPPRPSRRMAGRPR